MTDPTSLSLRRMKRLISLQASTNTLKGSLPDALSSMLALSSLYLAANHLRSTLPAALGTLRTPEKAKRGGGKPHIIDLLMGLFKGAVFRHGEGALKQPIKQPTETPTSTLALMGGPFSLVNGPFSDLNGAFHRFRPKGQFYLLKIHWKTAH